MAVLFGKEFNNLPRGFLRPKLASEFIHEVNMSQSTVESPMALYSAKTWVGISPYNSWFVFSAQKTIGDWCFHREAFIVRLPF